MIEIRFIDMENFFYETVKTINGKRKVTRLRSSVIIWTGILCIPVGIILLYLEMVVGAFILFTLCPCLLIYPMIRFFFFGGEDSIWGVVTTVVVEEVSKSVIKDLLNGKKK